MSPACPRPCGRLAMAAIFISVGVVQLVAGAFLLKSKYVYLLSAPDFWTAFCNIAVGGLLGVSAGVWNSTSKNSTKHAVRRNVLAALVTSSIVINLTTAVIFILGEGNTLLSIHLENNGVYTSATLASEILAYAYAASVCSPIFCVVVAIIFLSGMCFPNGRRKSLDIQKASESDPSTFNWVYKTAQSGLPKPDPEIVKKVLSSKSFTSSNDSSSSEFSIRPNSIPRCDTSLTRGISAIEKQNSKECPRTVHRCTECVVNYSDTGVARNGNRISFVDESPVEGRKIQRAIQSSSESFNPCNLPRFKTKRKDYLYELDDNSRNVQENEELHKLEGTDAIYHPQDPSSSVANVSSASECSRHTPSRIFSNKTECLSPDENFGENLRCFKHRSLRRTSTQASITRTPVQKMYRDRQNCDDSQSESLNQTMVQKTISWESCDTAAQNSERTRLDQTNMSVDSRADTLFGEVIPIQVNTFPRKKLQSKLIPVSIPIISNAKHGSLMKRKEIKFEDSRKEGFSSFHGVRQMKNRSKSTGSSSTKYSLPTFPTTRDVTVSEAPVDETNLEMSPAHTSGYISTTEDIVEPQMLDSSKSNKASASNSSPSGGSGSSGYVSVKKKFRAAQRKILDGGRPLSKTNAINDILKEIIRENPLLSNKDAVNELIYNLLLQKVTSEVEDY